MRSCGDAWDTLHAVTDKLLAVAENLTVTLVANRKNCLSGDPHDRATEYLSDAEANQLLTGFRTAGFQTRFYDGERAFITSVLNGEWKSTGRQILYNLAQFGSDPGRASLVPSFCALYGIPICNSDSYTVSFGRYKPHWQALLDRYGIVTPRTWLYRRGLGWLREAKPPSDLPLIAKASRESASIGIDSSSIGTLSPAFEAGLAAKADRLDQDLVVQQLIAGREAEQPVVELQGTYHPLDPLGVTIGDKPILGTQVLDFELVARDAYGFCEMHEPHTEEAIRTTAAAVGEILGLKGFSRVDFRIDEKGGIFVIDVAAAPHLVSHSSFARVFESAGWTHERMLACMIACAAARLAWI